MRLSDFGIGREFTCGGSTWRCTDVGTRVVVAIRLDEVSTTSAALDGVAGDRTERLLGRDEADRGGWFSGPPYAVREEVFDEDDLPACETVSRT